MGKITNWLLVLIALIVTAGPAAADLIKGRVKSVAPEAKAFTIINGDTARFILWDNGTVWKNFTRPAELLLDEALQVETRGGNENCLAVSIMRPELRAPAGVRLLSVESLLEARAGDTVTVVDVRPADAFAAGHIPGAISLPLSRVEVKAFARLSGDRSRPLALYDGGGDSESALKAAAILQQAGFRDISIVVNGIAGWSTQDRFPAVTTDYIRKVRPSVIDLREPVRVAAGHIGEAVNFQLENLAAHYGDLPLERGAALVVYGASDADAIAGGLILRKWGYKNVGYFPGGVAAWLAANEVLDHGPGEPQIISTAGRHGASLQADEFRLAAESLSVVELLDVRSASLQQAGTLPKAVRIPLPELPKRYRELDRERITVIYGEDPVRAEMAFDFLKGKGLRVNYLHGAVEFGPGGKFTVK